MRIFASQVRRKTVRALLPVALFFLSGCAAIIDGTSAEVMFTSEPPGAIVAARDTQGVTPCKLNIPKNEDSVEFRFGDEVVIVDLESSFGVGWLFLDIFLTPGYGVTGVLVDGITGAWLSPPALVHLDVTDSAKNVGVAKAVAQSLGEVEDER